MLGMRYIRENANKVREYLKNRNSDFDLDGFLIVKSYSISNSH